MRVLIDNVNSNSNSGPNSFGKKLISEFNRTGHQASTSLLDPDVQLSFIFATQKKAKLALRLDGIYFNTRQDWRLQNKQIQSSHYDAKKVIYQSFFNKSLTEKYFGAKDGVVINNGVCLETISKIQPIVSPQLDRFSEVWVCASSWRPHKRLRDNVQYFLSFAPSTAGLVILGENPDHLLKHPRIIYANQQSWETCVAIYRRAKVFLHLAFLDHCPNVVVDARASGCDLIVASSGGTKEIAGPNATVIQDIDWDFEPLDLYSPPPLNYDKVTKNNFDCNIDIVDVCRRYVDVLESI